MASKFKERIVRPVRGYIIYQFIHPIFAIGPYMPRKFLLWWHGLLAIVVYFFSKQTKKAIKQHLEIAFGTEKQEGEYYKLGKRLYIFFAKIFTDYALFGKLKTREQFSRYFKFEGEEYLKEAYERGKGVLCLVPHTIGWEFSAIMPPVMGYKTMGVSSRIHNPALHKLMVEMRESRGMSNITRDHCFYTLIERLKRGECLIIMIDQDSSHIRGEFLKFFGKEAYTPIGCARLALATGAPILPMYTIRNDEDDTYVFRILPEIPFEQKDTDLETFRYNTQKHNDALEQIFRNYPDQWIWMHHRWRTTPEWMRQYIIDKKIDANHYSSSSSHIAE